jgi:hypothetical protein
MALLRFIELIRFLTAPLLFFVFFLISGDATSLDRSPGAASITVKARAIEIESSMIDIAPGLHLRVTGAWHLTSSSPDFGGLSALYASGTSLTFVSDKGALIRLGVDPANSNWRGTIAPLPDACGDVSNRTQRDTESLASDGGTGALWIGFELRNAICRIAGPEEGGTSFQAPPSMASWAATSGPEAMLRRRDGRFLVFQEKSVDGSATNELLAFARDPLVAGSKPVSMRYRPPSRYLPVDAAELPDGRLLVLSRRFALPFNFTSRINLVDVGVHKAGRTVAGPIIARIDDPRIADNYEAISVEPLDDRLIIWLASDDNFMKAQRTILLRLEWRLPR